MSTSQLERRALRALALSISMWLSFAPAARADLSEQWYLLRARANMQIKNYRAAIEAYRKAVEKAPGNREALRGLGVALESNGETDEAIAAYDRYLERYPDDAEVAFKQAHVLGWSRYRYRAKDAIRYYRMGLAARDDPRERLALARLLGQSKETLDEALEDYRIVLRATPGDRKALAEYRKLLLWDPRHRGEAIEQYRQIVKERPDDGEAARQLARLLAGDPDRRAEATDAYARLVERYPKDRTLRLEYGRLLSQDPARREEAVEQLREGSKDKDDLQTRRIIADLLAGDEAQRDRALDEFRELVRKEPGDLDLRIRYARLLAARRETSQEAIEQYEQVLERQPDNAEAHAGLARAYAWSGDRDRALHHQQIAVSQRANEGDLRILGERLGAGREPRLGAGFTSLYQTGGGYGLFGIRVPARARTDLTPFATATLEGGFESYNDLASHTAVGGYFSIEGEARPSTSLRARLGVGAQTMREDADAVSARIELEYRDEDLVLRPGYERQPRSDTLVALVGAVAPARIDPVTSNLFSFYLERRAGDWRFRVAPFAGILTGGLDNNTEVGTDAGIEAAVIEAAPWHLSLGYDAQVLHYGHDEGSGPTPRYFSPALYASQTPRATLRYATERRWFELSAGPSLQLQILQGGGAQLLPGGQVRAAGALALAPRLDLELGGAIARTGDAYLRLDLRGSLFYLF